MIRFYCVYTVDEDGCSGLQSNVWSLLVIGLVLSKEAGTLLPKGWMLNRETSQWPMHICPAYRSHEWLLDKKFQVRISMALDKGVKSGISLLQQQVHSLGKISLSRPEIHLPGISTAPLDHQHKFRLMYASFAKSQHFSLPPSRFVILLFTDAVSRLRLSHTFSGSIQTNTTSPSLPPILSATIGHSSIHETRTSDNWPCYYLWYQNTLCLLRSFATRQISASTSTFYLDPCVVQLSTQILWHIFFQPISKSKPPNTRSWGKS